MNPSLVDYTDSREHSQLKLNNLIYQLQQLRNTHGNMPVVFWNTAAAFPPPEEATGMLTPYVICQFSKLENFISVDDDVLWIGGFGELGSNFLNIQM